MLLDFDLTSRSELELLTKSKGSCHCGISSWHDFTFLVAGLVSASNAHAITRNMHSWKFKQKEALFISKNKASTVKSGGRAIIA